MTEEPYPRMRSNQDFLRLLQPLVPDISVESADPASNLGFSWSTKSSPSLFLPLAADSDRVYEEANRSLRNEAYYQGFKGTPTSASLDGERPIFPDPFRKMSLPQHSKLVLTPPKLLPCQSRLSVAASDLDLLGASAPPKSVSLDFNELRSVYGGFHEIARRSSELARIAQVAFQEIGSVDAESGEFLLAKQVDPAVVGFSREFICAASRELEVLAAVGLAQTTAKARQACLETSTFTSKEKAQLISLPLSDRALFPPQWSEASLAQRRSRIQEEQSRALTTHLLAAPKKFNQQPRRYGQQPKRRDSRQGKPGSDSRRRDQPYRQHQRQRPRPQAPRSNGQNQGQPRQKSNQQPFQ